MLTPLIEFSIGRTMTSLSNIIHDQMTDGMSGLMFYCSGCPEHTRVWDWRPAWLHVVNSQKPLCPKFPWYFHLSICNDAWNMRTSFSLIGRTSWRSNSKHLMIDIAQLRKLRDLDSPLQGDVVSWSSIHWNLQEDSEVSHLRRYLIYHKFGRHTIWIIVLYISQIRETCNHNLNHCTIIYYIPGHEKPTTFMNCTKLVQVHIIHLANLRTCQYLVALGQHRWSELQPAPRVGTSERTSLVVSAFQISLYTCIKKKKSSD